LRHIGEQHILLPIAWQLFAAKLAATCSAAPCGTIISSLFCSYFWHNYQQPILQLLVAQLSAAFSAAPCGTINNILFLPHCHKEFAYCHSVQKPKIFQ
jgi:hypothetical protein